MSVASEFKEFILRGNMIDLAVGIIVGAAFSAVIKSLVDNVLMPPLGWALGQVDFAELAVRIPVPEGTGDPVEIKYGLFINSCIALIIQGLAIFVVIKVINSMKRKQEVAPKDTPTPIDVVLLTEIRDLLAKR